MNETSQQLQEALVYWTEHIHLFRKLVDPDSVTIILGERIGQSMLLPLILFAYY